jgi:hypothetical protein
VRSLLCRTEYGDDYAIAHSHPSCVGRPLYIDLGFTRFSLCAKKSYEKKKKEEKVVTVVLSP